MLINFHNTLKNIFSTKEKSGKREKIEHR